MAGWTVKRTDTFLKHLKRHKSNEELLSQLDKKIMRLKTDPFSAGGELSGKLHGHRSTRLSRNFRLIFCIDPENNVVYLEALDHRKDAY